MKVEKPAEKKPAEKKQKKEEKPVEKKEEKPVEKKEEKLQEKRSGNKNRHKGKQSRAKKSQEKSTEEKPQEEKPAEKKAAEEKPQEEKPTEEKAAEEKPQEEKPVEEKPKNRSNKNRSNKKKQTLNRKPNSALKKTQTPEVNAEQPSEPVPVSTPAEPAPVIEEANDKPKKNQRQNRNKRQGKKQNQNQNQNQTESVAIEEAVQSKSKMNVDAKPFIMPVASTTTPNYSKDRYTRNSGYYRTNDLNDPNKTVNWEKDYRRVNFTRRYSVSDSPNPHETDATKLAMSNEYPKNNRKHRNINRNNVQRGNRPAFEQLIEDLKGDQSELLSIRVSRSLESFIISRS